MAVQIADGSEAVDSPASQSNRGQNNREQATAGQQALKRLGAPIRGKLRLGQFLVIISGLLVIAPYMALVNLGDILLEAFQSGVAPNAQRVQTVIVFLVGMYSARLFLYFVAMLITHFADLTLRDYLRRQIVQRLARAPLSYFTAATSGRVRKAVQDDTVTVHTVIAHAPIERLNAIVQPLALLAYAFWVDWRLGLLSVGTIPLYILTYSFTLRGMNEKTVEMDRKLAAVSSTMAEFVAGISVVKAFGVVGRAHAAYRNAAKDYADFYHAWSMPLLTISCLSYVWVSIPVLLLVNLGGGSLLLQAGFVTLPQLLATTLIGLALPGALITIASISWSYQLAGAAALRLCDILETPVLSDTDDPHRPANARVDIEQVTFSYGDTLAVDNASLVLEPGTVTALLGPSGSGKSTLATLITRFADPASGAIRIGGVDLRDMDESALYDTVSFVLQDAQLLNASIRENIALGRPDARLEEIRAAAAVARIDDDIMALPAGYDTILGTETALSGGQEQRIAIARALLLDNPVLLLDEATAFADPESEAEIQQALSELVRGRTVLVIAHRPAAIRGADRIVVMERGRIVAMGRHEELLAEPHYRALLRANGLDPDNPAAAGSHLQKQNAAGEKPVRMARDTPLSASGAGGALMSQAETHAVTHADISDSRDDISSITALNGTAGGRIGGSLLAHYRRLMTGLSWRNLIGGIALGFICGTVSGAALLVLLPASVALATGSSYWGLNFAGWMIALAVCALLAAVLDYFGQRRGFLGALGFIRDIYDAIGDKVARLPLSWFSADSAGTLSRAVSQEMMSLAESAAHYLYRISSTVASCLVIWGGSWFWDWHLGLLLTLAAPPIALLLRLSRRLLNRGKAIVEPHEREMAGRIVEFSRCQGALRSCHASASYPRLIQSFTAGDKAAHRALWWESAGMVLNGVFVQVVVVGMIVVSGQLAVSGRLSPLGTIATIGMSLRFTTMLEDLGSGVMAMEERRQMMAHLDEVMDAPILSVPQESKRLTAPGSVELVDVDFGYADEVPVLQGVSLRVPNRTMCAVVGPSGSGKTTIARLVARFYDVDSGCVRVSGADVRELTSEDLMEQLSMVFQDVYLFDDTLEANIRLGDPQATDEQLRWAADLAGVTEIVNRLPGGWEARVGEGGRALSGGERQRVSIARALLKRAPIVLFDEATSALDAENEANVVAAMNELRRTSTLLVIAHKLETIATADQVVVLSADGRVTQQGRHTELVKVPGPYQDFWNYRHRAGGWQLV